MDDFINAFETIRSDTELLQFIDRYGLTTDGLDQRPRGQVYKVVGGTVNGRTVKLTHRWHDPSQAFAVKPDIAKVDLDIDAQRIATIEWPED